VSYVKAHGQVSFGQLTPQQRDIVTREPSTIIVKGLAGTGKTAVAVHRAHFLAERYGTDRVVLVSFAKNLSGYMQSLTDSAHKLNIMTLHQLCFKIFRGGRQRDVVNSKEIIEEATEWARNKYGDTDSRLCEPDFVDQEISWIKGRMLGDRGAYSLAQRSGRGQAMRPDVRQIMWEMYEFYEDRLKKAAKMDYADFALEALRALRAGRCVSYEHVVVDEAQDATPAQLRVLSEMVLDEPKSIFLATDPAQGIWRRQL
jgi:superfamily I DNA/RNA helicase